MNLTPHFTWEEATISPTATKLLIPNRPTVAEERRILRTARGMENIRELLQAPIIVHSWYRSPALNEKVGGKKNSQHLRGEAVDWTAPRFGSPEEIFEHLKNSRLRWDQLILESPRDGGPAWIHTSFRRRAQRRDVLSLVTERPRAPG